MRGIPLALVGVLVTSFLGACGDGGSAGQPVAVTPAAASTPGASTVVWLTDAAEAKRQAAERKVPILAVFSGSDWCVPCQLLKKEVFDTPAFAAWAAGAVVPLELDFPQHIAQSEALKKQNQDLFEHYNLDGYPIVLVLAADGAKRGELGYLAGGPQPWIAKAQEIIAAK